MPKRNLTWLTLSAFAVVALLASACQPAAPAEPKVVTITFTQEPDNLSPLYTSMWFSAITRDLWNVGLWDFDAQNNPVPQIAAEIPTLANGGVTNDGKTITIKLNPKAVWSDGTPITAADVQFTYDMVTSAKNAVSSSYPFADNVESVTAPDEHTVVVNFSEPFAPWLTLLFTANNDPVLPKHILQPVFDQAGTLDSAEWNRAPTVSAGPFVFKEWESGSHIIFEKNPKWWGAAPKIDQVFIRIVPDDAAQEAAIKAGETDIGVFLDYSQVQGINDSGLATVVTVLSGYDEGWYLNLRDGLGHPALQDVNVRRAIALATDRAKITQDLLLGLTEPPATFWAGTPPYGAPSLQPYPYDPDEARRLLDAAGWTDSNADGTRDKDGVELVLRYVTNQRQIRKDVQAVVQQMWASVGIGAELVNSDILFNSFGDGGPLATGAFDIGEWSDVGSFPDPDTSYWLCSQIPTADNPDGFNYEGYCSEEMDALFAQQAATADPDARREIFFEIQQKMVDEVLWIGMWKDPDLWSLSTRLSGVRLSGATPFWNAAEWDVAAP